MIRMITANAYAGNTAYENKPMFDCAFAVVNPFDFGTDKGTKRHRRGMNMIV